METQIEITKEFQDFINGAIEKEMKAEVDAAIARLEKRKDEIVAGVLLGVQKEVSVQQAGEVIIFTIKKIN